MGEPIRSAGISSRSASISLSLIHICFHYILDKEKNGTYLTNALYFKFELGGNVSGLKIEKDGDAYLVKDGDFVISLRIPVWTADGAKREPYLTQDGKALILPVYEGESTLLDTKALRDTCLLYTSRCV